MSEFSNDSKPEETTPHNFREATKVIARRFCEAAELQVRSPDYRHIMANRDPRVVTIPLVSFMLAQSYELAIEGRGDNLEIAIPLQQTELVSPELAADPEATFFIIDYKEDGKQKSLLITEEVYRLVFIDNPKPPIPDLPYKLTFYQVIPSRRPAA